MAKTTSEYHSSTARIIARSTLRRIATSAADQIGRDPHEVLKTLVNAQLKKQYADDPDMLPGALRFEMGLHDRDQLREVTGAIFSVLMS